MPRKKSKVRGQIVKNSTKYNVPASVCDIVWIACRKDMKFIVLRNVDQVRDKEMLCWKLVEVKLGGTTTRPSTTQVTRGPEGLFWMFWHILTQTYIQIHK